MSPQNQKSKQNPPAKLSNQLKQIPARKATPKVKNVAPGFSLVIDSKYVASIA